MFPNTYTARSQPQVPLLTVGFGRNMQNSSKPSPPATSKARTAPSSDKSHTENLSDDGAFLSDRAADVAPRHS